MDLSYTYLIAPSLLILVVIAAVWLDRFSVPVILVALGTGILFGSDVLNVWYFEMRPSPTRSPTSPWSSFCFRAAFPPSRWGCDRLRCRRADWPPGGSF